VTAGALLDLPLDGTLLVEGAAGSGKTALLADLVLRLVVERGVTPTRIGVLTALPGAVEACRSQLQARLETLLAAGLDGASPDPLGRRWAARYRDRAAVQAQLLDLQRDLSALPVMSFGYFCAWILEECGWSAGVEPGTWEGIGWERSFAARVAELWRRDSLALSPLLVEFLLQQGIGAGRLTREIQPYVGRDLQLLTPRPDDLAALESDYLASGQALREQWWAGGREALAGLWSRQEATRAGRQVVQQRLLPLDRWLAAETPGLGPELMALEAPAGIHPLFEAWRRHRQARAALLAGFRQWLAWYRGQLLRRAEELGRQRRLRGAMYSLEDRVLFLAEQLRGPRGERLAASARQRLAALVWDDCQQGSRLQHGIIQQLFVGTGAPVVLLGDPCQASDRFGRADVFAYLELRRRAERRQRLTGGFRQQPALGGVLSLLFSQDPQPFAVDLGGTRPASEQHAEVPELVVEDDAEPPFHFWWLGDDDGRAWRPEEAAELAAQACAGEIARLLNLAGAGQARLGERSLGADDIVVLVETQAQGRRMHGALLRVGVPGVRLAQEDVLHSREAEDLERVLLAAAEPWREERVLVALATDLMGLDGPRLLALREEVALRQEYLEAFRSYHELWRRHGFMRMFRSWLAEESVARRLLSFRDGERRLTNLLHISELLQNTAVQAGLGPEALCRWMRNRRHSRDSDEASLLRLASDEPRVRVITGHLAQGQAFPVVFCPFTWEVTDSPGVAALCHDPEDGQRPLVDFGSPRLDRHRQLAAREALGARLRFLYLLLTRVRCRLYLMWGKVAGQGASAPAWLLHRPPAAVADLRARFDYVEQLSAEQLLGDLSRLVGQAEGAIRIEYAPEELTSYEPPAAEQADLGFRYFAGPVRGRWRRWHWRELAPPGGQAWVRPAPVAQAPESLPVLLLEPAIRACGDAPALQAALLARGWPAAGAQALALPLLRLLRQPLLAGRGLDELLAGAVAEVAVCVSLAALGDGPPVPEAVAGLPDRGFLEDRIDWLIRLEERYHAVFLCWERWTTRTPALLGLRQWAELAGRALDCHLRQRLAGYQPARQLGAVHFLFPGAPGEAGAVVGHRYYPAPGAGLPEQPQALEDDHG